MRQEVAKPSASRRFWRLWIWVVPHPAVPCHLLPTILTSLSKSLFTSPPQKRSLAATTDHKDSNLDGQVGRWAASR
jgi:hypothetical protein